MKFEFVAKHRGVWPVTWMCEVLDVSPSGFYSWRSRPPSDRTRYDEILIRDIRRSFSDSGETYGVRRMWLDLLDWGHNIGRERVARLVCEAPGSAETPQATGGSGRALRECDRTEHPGPGLYGAGAKPEMGG